jgi:hypothetical protein
VIREREFERAVKEGKKRAESLVKAGAVVAMLKLCGFQFNDTPEPRFIPGM